MVHSSRMIDGAWGLRQRVAAFFTGLSSRLNTPRTAQFSRALSIGFAVTVVAYLVIRLSDVGWGNVWAARPRAWGFYALLFVAYVILPFSEILVYRLLWHRPLGRHALVFFRKRIYNNDILGYSGEAYLCLWARTALALPQALILRTVRDSNVLSAVASTALVALLLVILLATGQLHLALPAEARMISYGIVGALVAGLLMALALRFRSSLTSLPARLGWQVFSLHAARYMLGQSVLLGQWIVALPHVPISSLFTLLSVQMMVSRIPLLPSRDLIFISAGISLSSAMSLSDAAVASVLLVSSALSQVMNLIVFALGTIERRTVISQQD